MAPEGTRQLGILGVLVAVFLAVLYFNWPSDVVPVSTRRAAPTAPRARGGPATGMDAVRLAALGEARPAPADGGRNPFRFRASAPRPSAEAARPPAGVAAAPEPAGPPLPAGPPPPPPIMLKFIGIMEKPPTLKIAVLSDGRNVFYGREGDTIEGRYRIERIGVESIEMAYIDGRGRQSIRLSGS